MSAREHHEPSSEEKEEYFYGLSGKPRLVARTGSDTWTKPQHEEGWDRRIRQTPKRYERIHQRDIVEKWSRDVDLRIAQALKYCRWNYFFPIRIGLELEGSQFCTNSSVVVLIAVDEGTLSWTDGIAIAFQCRYILEAFQIVDVEVEILEGRYHAAAVSMEFEALFDRNDPAQEGFNIMHEQMQPLLSSIGFPIGYLEDRRGSGTVGLYVKLEGQEPVYGLTCRHVVHGDRQIDDSYRPPLPHQRQYHVQGNDTTFDNWLINWQKLSNLKKDTFDPLEAKINHWDNWRQYEENPKLHLKPSEMERETFDVLKLQVDYMEKVLKCASKLEEKETRKIGHLAWHPTFQVSTQKPGYLKDWALIELDLGKYPSPPENRVFMKPASYETMRDKVNTFTLPKLQNGHFRLSGGVSEKKSGGVVGKRGAATGLTFGYMNEIEAVIRSPDNHGREELCWELLIIPEEGTLKFSHNGDSGSSIFDCYGDVVGMVVGRTDHPKFKDEKRKKHSGDGIAPDKAEVTDATALRKKMVGTDITFATPIRWVLDDIEAFTGMKPQIV